MQNLNIDNKTVEGFGDEWTRFDQSGLSDAERLELFDRYFNIFPWKSLPKKAQGFDMGCGSGRWALLVAPRVELLNCIDASIDALSVSKRNLSNIDNCSFYQASVHDIPLDDNSQDFGYSLGVLHHIPNTKDALYSCVAKLKPGAPFLLYLYYSFDNKPFWFKVVWKFSNWVRRFISHTPMKIRYFLSLILAIVIYWPFAKISQLLDILGFDVDNVPLSSYRDVTFYVMKTDALDRFGTRLEQRFSRVEINSMMLNAGLKDITFSEQIPYWCAVGYKA